jgi:hypothetical protein
MDRKVAARRSEARTRAQALGRRRGPDDQHVGGAERERDGEDGREIGPTERWTVYWPMPGRVKIFSTISRLANSSRGSCSLPRRSASRQALPAW